MSAPVGIVGAGAWGTALAQMLASGRGASEGEAPPEVLLWARDPALADAINATRRNAIYLPSAELHPAIRAVDDLAALADCAVMLLVTPAQHLADVMRTMPVFAADLVLCSKGIEAGTGRMMRDVASALAPESEIAVLSGPTFAHEVAAGLPTAVTLACGGGEAQWRRLAPLIARDSFRPYYSDDVIGAEAGGAIKNVLAIACGVVEGLRFGQNARNALIARGFAEMLRFGDALGARPETLTGLCGLGDLVLTCSSTSSRNFSLGKALGEGHSADELMADRRTVAEGAHTAPVLRDLAARHDVAMPIVDAVNRLLEGASARDVAQDLLARPLTSESAFP